MVNNFVFTVGGVVWVGFVFSLFGNYFVVRGSFLFDDGDCILSADNGVYINGELLDVATITKLLTEQVMWWHFVVAVVAADVEHL